MSDVTYVICTRWPDADNEFEIFEGTEPGVEIIDVDLGRADLRDVDECIAWARWYLDIAYGLPHDPREALLDTVWGQLWELGLSGEALTRLLDEERKA